MQDTSLSISNLYRDNTMSQLDTIFKVSSDIITSLDDVALSELFGGYSWDVDKLLFDIIKETGQVLVTNDSLLKTASFNYLTNVTNQLDEYLKNTSFAYFTCNVLYEFDVAPYHLEWFNLVQIYKKLCIEAARGHSKSYVFSFAFPIWKMWQYKKGNKFGRQTLMITAEYGLVKSFLEMISKHIEENPILNEKLFPGSNAINWGRERIVAKNNAEIIVRGANSAMRGLHTDTIIVDDFLTEADMYNADIRKQDTDLFHSVIVNILNPGGQMVVVGTPFHENDLYFNLKNAKGWRVFEYPAIDPEGNVLYPERFGLEELLEKKESQGSITFSREILVRPVTSATSIFPIEIIRMALVGNERIVHNRYSIPFKFKRIGLGIDLAISANVGADYFVCTTIAIDEFDRYWILNIFREKGLTYRQQIEVVKKLNYNFNYDTIAVESNQYQEAFYQMLQDEGLENVIKHNTGMNKYSATIGLIAMSALFEQFRVRIPYDRTDPFTATLADLLLGELSSMTFANNKLQGVGAHDDMVMSLLKALIAVRYHFDSDIILSFLDKAA